MCSKQLFFRKIAKKLRKNVFASDIIARISGFGCTYTERKFANDKRCVWKHDCTILSQHSASWVDGGTIIVSAASRWIIPTAPLR